MAAPDAPVEVWDVTLWDATSLDETGTYPEPVQADGLSLSPDSATLAMSQKDEAEVLLCRSTAARLAS